MVAWAPSFEGERSAKSTALSKALTSTTGTINFFRHVRALNEHAVLVGDDHNSVTNGFDTATKYKTLVLLVVFCIRITSPCSNKWKD